MPSDERIAPAKVFAVGLGASRTVTTLGLEHAVTASLAMLEKVKAEHIAITVPLLPQLDAVAVGGVLSRALVAKWKAGRVVVLGDPSIAP